MSTSNHDFPRFSHPFRTAPCGFPTDDLDCITVPYAGQSQMRLAITSGMADARIRIAPDATELIAIDCGEGIPPRLRVSPTELRVSWPAPTLGSWLRAALAGEYHDLDIVLHPAVEWTLLVRGGLSHFEADLAAGKLARIEISGGISHARFDLPAPASTVPVRVSGGVSELALRRPADAGVSLGINGGVSALGLDDQRFGAIGGGARLATGPIHGDAPRYAIEISGGASGLCVAAR